MSSTSATRRLFFASALTLFLELALIRWLSANVVHLSYFSNFVLLGSFLGIGIGFLISRRSWSVWRYSLPLLTLLVLAVGVYPVSIEREGSDLIYFTALSITGPPAWLMLPVIFLLVAAILAGPAEVMGRSFARLPALTAYRWDLLGSLLGIAAFTLISFLGAPSVVWAVIVTGTYLALSEAAVHRVITGVFGVTLVALLLVESLAPGVSWSPYYKIATQSVVAPDGTETVLIMANGVPHQVMAPAAWKLAEGEPIYGAVYDHLVDNPLRNVLVVGAGSGSDVAIALAQGAQHVDAVDIDPHILEIGIDRNPDRAYDDPRVDVHANDGRAFLQGVDTEYDLILFALPDSLTLVGGASQIRLESFLFTSEAITSVREHLSDRGAFAMYNYYREPWLIDRLAGTAESAFGHRPCVDTFDEVQAVVTIAKNEADQSCAGEYRPSGEVIAAATDNAPFLYFKGGAFPSLYLVTLGGILLASLLAVRAFGGPLRRMRPYLDLFFMGAAFLLLETKNVASYALLFGTTWLVNALVFAGVLVVVLAAVETTRRLRTPPLRVVFIAIAASLALAWLVQPSLLLGLPFLPRLVLASVIAFLPIYLANVAFAKRFAASSDSQSAFAVNLLGAIVGGCLEYSALLLGYNNLLLVAGALYLAAFLLVPKASRVGAALA